LDEIRLSSQKIFISTGEILHRKKGVAMNWKETQIKLRCQSQVAQVINGLRERKVNPADIGVQNVQLKKWSEGKSGIGLYRFAELADAAGYTIVVRPSEHKKK
tara:strand:+ start:427 stop:735 length:309 start_codon:yes stop_codon:yes gene_type:complete